MEDTHNAPRSTVDASSFQPHIRKFERKDQPQVEEMFRSGLQGTSTHDDKMRTLQNWFIDLKLSKEEGGDMYDVASYYLESGGDMAARRCFWVAEAANGQILGMVGVKEGSADGVGELVRMSVKPEARGMGLGGRLAGTVEEHVRGYGGHKVELTTLTVMELACALYKRNGFSVEKIEPIIIPHLDLPGDPFQVLTFVKEVGGRKETVSGHGFGGSEDAVANRDRAVDKKGKILRGLAKLRFSQHDSAPCEVAEGLFIGSIGAASSQEALEKMRITSVLTVCDDEPPRFPGVSYLSVSELPDRPSADILSRFPTCCDFISEGLAAGRVLVHCFQGKSRSSAVVAAFLVRERGQTVQEALDQVRSVRPRAQPNLGFLAQLRTWEKACSGHRGGGGVHAA